MAVQQALLSFALWGVPIHGLGIKGQLLPYDRPGPSQGMAGVGICVWNTIARSANRDCVLVYWLLGSPASAKTKCASVQHAPVRCRRQVPRNRVEHCAQSRSCWRMGIPASVPMPGSGGAMAVAIETVMGLCGESV